MIDKRHRIINLYITRVSYHILSLLILPVVKYHLISTLDRCVNINQPYVVNNYKWGPKKCTNNSYE
jgi:hypothetical protein